VSNCKNCGHEVPNYGTEYLPPSNQQLGHRDWEQLSKILVRYDNALPVVASGVVVARVLTPSVRCRTRLTLILDNIEELPGAAADPVTTDNTTRVGLTPPTLWMASQVRPKSRSRYFSPVRNLVGTRTAPLTIPTDVGLWGYDLQTETFGEQIWTRLNVTSAGINNVEWKLLVQYASVTPLTDTEWAKAIAGIGGIMAQPENGIRISDGSG
jgi:hypothetical protein